MMIARLSIKLAGLVLAGAPAAANKDERLQDSRLQVAMKLDMPSAGVSVAPGGRKFFVIFRTIAISPSASALI